VIPFPDKKYNIIYADPAWSYLSWSEKGGARSPDRHYDCMDIEDIKNLSIKNIADKDCILFIWIPFPFLDQGLEVIKKWDFEYKTVAFNWVKKNKIADSLFWGMGRWTRSNAEICLLAIKGKPKRISAKVHQVIIEKIREHSRKPDCVRDRIVELCGDLPRIELFARQKVDGWDAWGNEV
jgi:N6-adenosine-specific RNA methylase IME4